MRLFKQFIVGIAALLLLAGVTACSNRQNDNIHNSDPLFSVASSADENPLSTIGNDTPAAIDNNDKEIENSETLLMSAQIDIFPESDKSSADAVSQHDKIFIECYHSLALSTDGILYRLSMNSGNIVYNQIMSEVQKMNMQFTSDERPAFQTFDNRFFGYFNYNAFEYEHSFSKPYLLLGNNMVKDEASDSIYRVNWSKEGITTDDDLKYIMVAKYATDLTFYTDI